MNSLKEIKQQNQQLPQTNQIPLNLNQNPQFTGNQPPMNQGFQFNQIQNPNFQQIPNDSWSRFVQ